MAKHFTLKPPAMPTEDVMIDLGDGIKRPLRFSIRSLKMLKEMGLNPQASAFNFNVEDLPRLIFAGLHDQKGRPPADVTIETLEALPINWLDYLSKAFFASFTQSMPEKAPPVAGELGPGDEKNAQSPAA